MTVVVALRIRACQQTDSESEVCLIEALSDSPRSQDGLSGNVVLW